MGSGVGGSGLVRDDEPIWGVELISPWYMQAFALSCGVGVPFFLHCV